MHLSRRGFLASSSAMLGLSFTPHGAAMAQAGELNVFAHKVHEAVATRGKSGSVVQPWVDKNGVPVAWTTFDPGPLRERLLREASLNTTSVDIGFLLNTQVTPETATLFEPLDAYLASDPIEEVGDIFPGLINGMKVGGMQIGMPVRHSSSGLHYNEQILEERGFSAPPATIEELIEMVQACTYRRDDGTEVHGYANPGMGASNVVDIARAWNGDFVTLDYKCVADQQGMVNAIRLFKQFYENGNVPKNFLSFGSEDISTLIQNGRVVFCAQGMSRNQIFNDPQRSSYAGRIKTVSLPASRDFISQFPVAPAKVEFWGMVIPKHSRNKELSWSLIKHMLTKDSTLKMALNGNGPVRGSTYEDAEFASQVSYGKEERRVLEVARVPLPAFSESARAGDIFKEEAESAVLGLKSVEEAMASVVARVTPLLPA